MSQNFSRIFFSCLFFFSLYSFANISETDVQKVLDQTPKSFLGLWYGKYTFDNGVKQTWITDRKSDGSFRSDYRFFKNDKLLFRAYQLGKWGANEKYYEALVLNAFKDGEIDPIKKGMRFIRYSIISISKLEFRYKTGSGEYEFIVQKISERPPIFEQ